MKSRLSLRLFVFSMVLALFGPAAVTGAEVERQISVPPDIRDRLLRYMQNENIRMPNEVIGEFLAASGFLPAEYQDSVRYNRRNSTLSVTAPEDDITELEAKIRAIAFEPPQQMLIVPEFDFSVAEPDRVEASSTPALAEPAAPEAKLASSPSTAPSPATADGGPIGVSGLNGHSGRATPGTREFRSVDGPSIVIGGDQPGMVGIGKTGNLPSIEVTYHTKENQLEVRWKLDLSREDGYEATILGEKVMVELDPADPAGVAQIELPVTELIEGRFVSSTRPLRLHWSRIGSDGKPQDSEEIQERQQQS